MFKIIRCFRLHVASCRLFRHGFCPAKESHEVNEFPNPEGIAAQQNSISEPEPSRYDSKLVEAFNLVLNPDNPVLILPAGTFLYRGGECTSCEHFRVRRDNVFLTTHESYADSYTHFRNQLPYRYTYRAQLCKNLNFAVVKSMKEVIDVAVSDLKLIKPNAAALWQRANIIALAREALKQNIAGIYFASDLKSDEVLLDNCEDALIINEVRIYRSRCLVPGSGGAGLT